MTPIQPCSEYIQNKFHIITYALASALVKFVGIPICLYVVFVLKTCGAIEVNPGPSRIQKSVQPRFIQGHLRFVGTRGIQFSCRSLYGICFSAFKNVSRE